MEHIHLFNLLWFFLLLCRTTTSSASNMGTYIIHMDKSAIPAPFSTHHSWYTSTLSSLSVSESEIAPVHLYSYKHVMDGFSAVLSISQLTQLEKTSGHVATYVEQFGQLHTTRTPEFLGLKKHSGVWPAGGYGDDIIIGILDSGIWPESESFSDHGMPPVPLRWRGVCESGVEFNSSNCNRKVIGARSFSEGMKQRNEVISTRDDYDSPRDFEGHGSHTSSIAAGRRVEDVEYFGYAKGTATGVAPLARLAMYKVLFSNDSYDSAASDTLAGIDQAIEDGVDLMSLSLGFHETPFYDNPIAVGTFAAMEKGIFVSCSAGNEGPEGYSIHNGAPWITTVGAGTIDREFVANVTLGDGVTTIKGKSVYPADLLVSRVPLYNGHQNISKRNCEDYSLDSNEVKEKIVFCSFNNVTNLDSQMYEVYRSGAKGGIFATDTAQFLYPTDFYLPFVATSLNNGKIVENYLMKTPMPTVDVKFQITELGTTPAPQVANFSSRGPNPQAPWILKPDILAPGVEIVGAWVPNRGDAPLGNDYLNTDYSLGSGTSLASPHVVGIAALLKSAHHDWSSAAIRSAMMTTADLIDNANGQIIDMTRGRAGTPLDFGAGQVNPNKALDPGLVYDIEVEDYINFLCALNYTSQQIKVISRRSNYNCDQASLDLNYPSFIVILNNTNTISYTFIRVLTNVADSQSVYRAEVWTPKGMKVSVEPMTLTFGGKNSKAEFRVDIEIDAGGYMRDTTYIGGYGYLSWHEVDGKHVVRSPVVSAFSA